MVFPKAGYLRRVTKRVGNGNVFTYFCEMNGKVPESHFELLLSEQPLQYTGVRTSSSIIAFSPKQINKSTLPSVKLLIIYSLPSLSMNVNTLTVHLFTLTAIAKSWRRVASGQKISPWKRMRLLVEKKTDWRLIFDGLSYY